MPAISCHQEDGKTFKVPCLPGRASSPMMKLLGSLMDIYTPRPTIAKECASPTPDPHDRPPIRHPTPASPKAPRQRLGKMPQTEYSWPDTEQSDLMRAVKPRAPVSDNMGVGTGSKAPLQRLGKMQQTEYGLLDTEHSQDDSMPTAKLRAPVPDNMHVGTSSNGRSGRPLKRQIDGLVDTEQSQDDMMHAVKPRAPVPDNMHVGTSSNGRSGRPLKRRILEPPESLARAKTLGTHSPPSPSRSASSSRLREAAQIGQPEQQPDATAATRRRLSPPGWLSSTDISQLIAKFIQPDSRLLDIGRSGDGGPPWSEWTAHYTLKTEHKHVLVPVQMARSHWILLHVDIPASRARVYDSLAPSLVVRDAEDMARAIMSSMDISWDGSWKVEMVTHVRQTGTDDCGVFVIIFAIYIVARAPLPTEANAPLWRLLFQYLLLGEIETGVDHLVQDDQAVQGSESRQMLLGLHEAAARAKKLSKLDRDLSAMSRPVLDIMVKTNRRVEQDAMAIEAQSAHVEDHRRSLAYHFPSSSSEQQAPRASGERDMMAAVLGWMETKLVRLKAARAAAQAGAKEMQAGYQALKDLVDTAIAESDEQLRRARVATDEAAKILGELGK
ncbi:uncharacterized protein J3D65DRAFT_310012 [Phyllosticta citribraziliensis]|uniref:Ubiquitin-like protease family profile domain-containing protein n=1 Tax=Phyllosticta citribraziliensis TaxID=989973 RepID=A0ABR1LZB6_9PEZI